MLLSVRRRFLFVANTRTASTSLTAALRPLAEIERGGTPQRKHIPFRDVLEEYRFVFGQPGMAPEGFLKFAVMREPVDWIRSWYRYRRGNRTAHPLPEGMSFADFWALNDWNRTRADGTRNLQRARFEAPDGRIGLDLILPFHDLDAELAALAPVLGLKGPLPRLNAGKGSDAGAIDPALAAEIRDFYAADHEVFDSLPRINAAGRERLAARQASAG